MGYYQGKRWEPFAPNMIDFYKSGHRVQYPEGTEYVSENFTPRSDIYAHVDRQTWDHKAVVFGLQGTLKEVIAMWHDSFFSQPKAKAVARYKRRMDMALGPDAVPVDHLEALHDLGYLPLRIKALPEGSRVNVRVAQFTVINTDKRFAWLPGYMEDQLSTETWKYSNNATISYNYWKLLTEFALLTGTDPNFVRWQGHDFSFRGMSGMHDGVKSGCAHLLCFMGTDTVGALDYAEDFYNGTNTFLGGSVPATEHCVTCVNGKGNEREFFKRLITETYPNGIVSAVSDTWDFWHVLTVTLPSLEKEILARGKDAFGNSKVVVRPDSGDPVKIIAGYRVAQTTHDSKEDYELALAESPTDAEAVFINGKYYEITNQKVGAELPWYVVLGAVEVLGNRFGWIRTTGSNGEQFRSIMPRINLIYGDSITLVRARNILQRLYNKGIAWTGVFGIGSYTYNYSTRDSLGFAMKATWAQVKGESLDIYKDPKTDSGVKKSARGMLRIEKVVESDGSEEWIQYDQQTPEQEKQGELRVVYEGGYLMIDEDFATLRNRLGCLVTPASAV